ncbi:hypothetical protein FQ033_17800 [Escherichia coli]|nr:hypothetical protein [Escherichia coli]
MQRIPDGLLQVSLYPFPLSRQPGCRSISDDDLCAWCSHLCYRPGELSLCRLFLSDGSWPARSDADGYARSCPALRLNRNTPPGK